jgi:hypothetical protein
MTLSFNCCESLVKQSKRSSDINLKERFFAVPPLYNSCDLEKPVSGKEHWLGAQDFRYIIYEQIKQIT